MPEAKLRLELIGFGQCLEKANEALEIVCADVVGRKLLREGREVTVKISICPDASEDGRVNNPTVDWSVRWSIPGAKGLQTRAFVEGGEVKLDVNNADARQRLLFDEKPSAADEDRGVINFGK
jgi:hypothetical protein